MYRTNCIKYTKVAAIVCIVLLVVLGLSGCWLPLKKSYTTYDYFGKIEYKLPFEHSGWTGTRHVFSTDLSVDEMVKAVNDAGDYAQVCNYKFDEPINLSTRGKQPERWTEFAMYIRIVRDSKIANFVVYKGDQGNYVIVAPGLRLNDLPFAGFTVYFPVHKLTRIDATMPLHQVYVDMTFEELVEFYSIFNQDVTVDIDNKIIQLRLNPVDYYNWQGVYQIQFVDGEQNYVEILQVDSI
jgi:hypothetical protein